MCPLWWDALGVPCVLLKSPKCQSHAYPTTKAGTWGPQPRQPSPSAVCHSAGEARRSSSLGPQPDVGPGSGGIGQGGTGGGVEQSRRPFMEKEEGALQGDGGEWAEMNQQRRLQPKASLGPRPDEPWPSWPGLPHPRFQTPGLAPSRRPGTSLLLPHREETHAQGRT